MIRTDEYYGGTYPEPNEVIDEDDELDFGWDLADMYYEDMKLFDE